ncbi:MAG: aldehyde ferredoxin oxidoreductase family protein [Spirochaetes bacterium]|nr:aldehyde ferredoxin oxidoreductase family protein [Spirochaetota bacterium]
MYGNTGKVAYINCTTRSVDEVLLQGDIYKKYIGGSGLAAKLFWDYADFNAEPFSEKSVLIFMNGPLAGVPLSGTSRMSAAARSPLTGVFAESSCGGYFSPQLKFAGYDGLIVTGGCEKPSIIHIKEGCITIVPADELWGKTVSDTYSRIKENYGNRCKTLIIGPAGENGVAYACILSDAHHAFGRCGLGAVMGSKKIKAIVIEPHKSSMNYSDKKKIDNLIKELTPRIKEYVISQVLHEFGSAGNLEGHMYTGDVPIKNWTSNFNEEMAENLTGSTLTDKYLTKTGTCAYCVIGCKRIVKVDEEPFTIPEGPGPEYETVVSLGCLLGSSDLAAVCKAGRLCNEYGMDTISTGATIAWAMEAFERGDLTQKETGGLTLQWGDMLTVINKIIPSIALQQGHLGQLLAKGSRAAALSIGKDAINYTAQSKGLEAPMHDPRGGGHGHALAYAVTPRGACHVSTAMHFMETGACNYPEIGFEFDLQALTDEKKPETMVLAAAIGSIENSACFCQYANRSLSFTEMIDILNAVAGYDYTLQDALHAGWRIFHLKRLINHRLGVRASDDTLTQRMLEPARDGEPQGIVINFENMKQRFYELMHLDSKEGVATIETLKEYGLEQEAAIVWGKNI